MFADWTSCCICPKGEQVYLHKAICAFSVYWSDWFYDHTPATATEANTAAPATAAATSTAATTAAIATAVASAATAATAGSRPCSGYLKICVGKATGPVAPSRRGSVHHFLHTAATSTAATRATGARGATGATGATRATGTTTTTAPDSHPTSSGILQVCVDETVGATPAGWGGWFHHRTPGTTAATPTATAASGKGGAAAATS